MSPHGALRWRVPFDGVGSCEGGGVVARLMDGVYGGVEYDVEARGMMFEAWSMVFEARSMMLEVVFAPK